MTSLLIVDDEPALSASLARALVRDGYEVDWTTNPQEAVERITARNYDIVVSDLRMPELTGIDVLERAKRINPSGDFVIMTAYATPQTAVEAMKKGAVDYLIKPFGVDELKSLVKRIEATRPLKEEPAAATAVATAGKPAAGQAVLDAIVAPSSRMQEVLARVKKVAASNASILLCGESGTGKEVLAKAIHSMSPRADGPLVVVNCGAIPETLLESELFGHLKGSFTGAIENRKGMFQTAHGGTIFLDEIGDLPLHLQVKLLRVLQEGEVQKIGESTPQKVDVRVLAATNRNLEEAVAKNEFRQDLYYRLNVIPIQLPALRDRRDDLEPLIEHFLRKFDHGSKKSLAPDAKALLLKYDYPGNIRELENAIEHAVVLSDGDMIHVADLPIQIQNFEWSRSTGGSAADSMHLEEIEKRCILSALEKTRYNYTRAAAHLGITRRTLGYRIQKYELEETIDEAMLKLRQAKGERA